MKKALGYTIFPKIEENNCVMEKFSSPNSSKQIIKKYKTGISDFI